jgi:putative peptide zinc metalloprotease protein
MGATAPPEQPTRVMRPRERRFQRRDSHRREQPPRLAEGIELLGEFEDSGFKEAPWLARRADGQTIQLTRLLHLVAEAADGRRSYEQMAEVVTQGLGRGVSGDNVQFLVEKKLRPLGVLAAEDGSSPKVDKPDPLLALKFRTALVPDHVTRAFTTVFRPLFFPPVIAVIFCAFLAAIGWLFFVHGVGQGLRGLIYDPVYLLFLFGGLVLGTAFHEIGHATALRYGGGKPGVMGAGVYIVWPAFYTDVTDAYRLSRTGRLRTDLGGIYFNMIVAIIAVAIHLATGWEVILLLAVAQTFAITQQLLPLLRLDGYYILSDLTGIPDMLNRIRPVLKSAVPGKEADQKVTELKPWARRVITGYVLILVPVLAVLFAVMIVHAPRAFATAYDSFFVQVDRIDKALDGGGAPAVAGGVLQLVFLVLPLFGMVYTTTRVGRRGIGGAWDGTRERPLMRTALVAGTAGAIALAAWTWWPNGDYRPIQPGEKGTLASAVRNLGEVPSGRPALTPQREQELGGAPFERDVRSGDATRPADGQSEAEQEREAREQRDAQDERDSRRDDDERGTQTTPTTPEEPAAPPAEEPVAPTETTPTEPAPAPEPNTPPTETTPPAETPPPPTDTTQQDPTTTTP